MYLKEISRLLSEISYDDLPESTIEQAKINILNFIGGAMGGASTLLSKAFVDMYDEMGGKPEANLFGYSKQLPAVNAAMINSSMSEAYLEEDMHMVSQGHPGTVVVPSAIAMAQRLNTGGKELIEAVVAGYEAVGRFGRCLINNTFADKGTRPSSFLGPFGAATAAGKLLNLSPDEMMNALSISGNTSSGLLEFANGETADYCYQNAFAVYCGFSSVNLAKRGVKSTPTLIEGSRGMGNAYSEGNYDFEALVRNFGNPYEIEATFIKVFPSCAYSQVTAQAALKLVEMYDINPDDVEKIDIGTYTTAYHWPACVNSGPYAGPVQTMMSHEFMAAAAIACKELSVRTVKLAQDEKILSLTAKASVFIDEECDKAFPPYKGATVKITMKDGSEYFNREKDVRGGDKDFVKARMIRNSSEYLREAAARDFIGRIENLEQEKNLNDIMALLVPAI